MKNANKLALALLAMSPLAASAMDIGLTVGARASFDIYNGEKLDFSDYKKPLATTTHTYSLQDSEIKLNKDFGAAGSLSIGAVLMNMLTLEIEGGYAMSFMQTGADADGSGLKAGANSINPSASGAVLKDKDIVAFHLPYFLASGYFSMEIPDTSIVPYVGGGAGMVFANLSFDDNAVDGKVTDSGGSTNLEDLKTLLKKEGDFKYNGGAIYQIGLGCGYKISDEMTASLGYRLMGGFSDLEYKNDKVSENIVKSKLMKHSVVGTLRYNMKF